MLGVGAEGRRRVVVVVVGNAAFHSHICRMLRRGRAGITGYGHSENVKSIMRRARGMPTFDEQCR